MSDRLSDDRQRVPPAVFAAVGGIAAAIAAVSMPVGPTALNFDPWAWLVWGRELLAGRLDTTGGPSWKPFPVLVTAPASALGDAAPVAWMFLSRAGAIAGVLLAGVLAARVVRRSDGAGASERLAAVASVVFVLLAPDVKPRWVRTLLVGHSDALAGGLSTLAVLAHLDKRYRTAWVSLVAASLIRPEAWPFLAGYGLWLAWTHRSRSTAWVYAVVASGAGVLVAWFGGDLLGSGSAWHGAETARRGRETVGDRILRIAEVTWSVVPPVAWVFVAVAVIAALSRLRARGDGVDTTDRFVVVATALAALWWAVVAGLTVVMSYAALSRFLMPASALLCVVGGVGVVRSVALLRRPGRARTALAVIVVIAALASTPQILALGEVWDETVEHGAVTADLTDAFDTARAAAGGTSALLACGQVTIEHRPLVRPQLAWLLDEPLHRVEVARDPVRPGVMFMVRGSKIDRHQTSQPADGWRQLAVNDHWRVIAIRCPVLLGGETG